MAAGFSDSVQCNIGLVSPTVSHKNVSHIKLVTLFIFHMDTLILGAVTNIRGWD